jgi:hypothetical protein
MVAVSSSHVVLFYADYLALLPFQGSIFRGSFPGLDLQELTSSIKVTDGPSGARGGNAYKMSECYEMTSTET